MGQETTTSSEQQTTPTESEQQPLLNNDKPKPSLGRRIIDNIKSWSVGTWIRLALVLLFITGVIVAITVFHVQKYFPEFLNFIKKLNSWAGGFIFAGIYAVATVCFIPGSILTLGGGFVFKLLKGILFVWVGATVGSVLAFLLGRTVLRSWVSERIKKYPKFRAIDGAIRDQAWKIVILLRLAPIVPFNLLNYALALTDVAFIHYFWATAVGMIPGTALYVYFGSLAGDLSDVINGKAGPSLKIQIIIWSVSGVLIIATVIFIIIMAKRAIAKAIAEQEEKEKIQNQNQTQNQNPTEYQNQIQNENPTEYQNQIQENPSDFQNQIQNEKSEV